MKKELIPYFDHDSPSRFDFRSWAELIHSKKIIAEGIEEIGQLIKRTKHVTGMSTGFRDVDSMTCGLQEGDLIILGGAPSMGKSSLALSIMMNIVVENKYKIAYFSSGMSYQLLVQRLLASSLGIDLHKIRGGWLSAEDWSEITNAANKFSEANVFIDDTSGISFSELQTKARWLKANHDIKLLIIDFLQLMHDFVETDGNPNKISKISRSLKELAFELNIPIILLSQLPRDVETRKNYRPRNMDLPGRGSIIQSADIVLLLFRKEYYKPTKKNRGLAEIIISKNRNGCVGCVNLSFIPEITRFENYNE